MKAAQYMVDANQKTNDHVLVVNCCGLDDSELKGLARELECLLGGSTMMRYPDQIKPPEVPNDVYSAKDALEALELARKIVDRVRERIA